MLLASAAITATGCHLLLLKPACWPAACLPFQWLLL
jgi:hypothetical protein